MEFILAILLSWPVLLFCLGVLMYSEHVQADGFAVGFLIITAIISYFMFGLSLAQFGILMAAWIPVGIVYSFWRWKRHCSDIVKKLRSKAMTTPEAERKVTLSNNLNKITHWIFVWPFSLLESLVGDVIDMVQSMITGILCRTYERVSANALTEIREQKTAERLVDFD